MKIRMHKKPKSIIVDTLTKSFDIVEKKRTGFGGFVKDIVSPEKRKFFALKNISFSIGKGEIVGFIGPNGAGKTTTLKVLSGLLYPTSGFVQVEGFNPWDKKNEYLKKISLVMGQKNQLWWDLPAVDTMELNRAIYEIPIKEYQDTLEELTELLDAKEYLYTQVRKLSLGQRMRMELIAALIHKPEVLFLDEPTLGLDVVGQQKLRDFIYDYNQKYRSTVILTSHNMQDLLNLAKRVIVIDKGQILFDGMLKKLTDDYVKEKTIKVYFSGEIDIKKLESVGRIKKIDFPMANIVVPREASAFAAAEILQNFPVADLTIEEESIESVIRRVFKGELKNG